MSQQIVTLLPLILLVVIMYFLLIRPQKKREKEINNMRNAVKVGDEIITIGGVCGKVVKTKDDTLTIQVGADKVKFEIMRWAVSKVVTAEPAPSKKAKREEPVEEKQEPSKKSLPKRMMKKTEEAPLADIPADAPAETEAVEEPENQDNQDNKE